MSAASAGSMANSGERNCPPCHFHLNFWGLVLERMKMRLNTEGRYRLIRHPGTIRRNL